MQAHTQALALVYLLCATFQKGHSTEPVTSGGAWLGGAQGHLSDPTTRRGGGGGVKGGGRQAGGGIATTRREQHTEPFAIRTMQGALVKLGDAKSSRK